MINGIWAELEGGGRAFKFGVGVGMERVGIVVGKIVGVDSASGVARSATATSGIEREVKKRLDWFCVLELVRSNQLIASVPP